MAGSNAAAAKTHKRRESTHTPLLPLAPALLATTGFRTILLALTGVSYVPQFYRVVAGRDVAGISAASVLFNAMMATEQLSIMLCPLILRRAPSLRLAREPGPPTLADWIDYGQLTLQCLCANALFVLYLLYSPGGIVNHWKLLAVIPVWTVHMWKSLDQALYYIVSPPTGRGIDWFLVWRTMHTYMIGPLCSVLALGAFVPQIRLIAQNGGETLALDMGSVAMQAVLFQLLAVSWYQHLRYPKWWRDKFEQRAGPGEWMIWYLEVGWPSVNAGIVGFAQTVVWMSWHRSRV